MKTTLISGLRAFDYSHSRGRSRLTSQKWRDPYLEDLVSATQSPFFRRLANKTQVFDPSLPVANRLKHSMMVFSVATRIAQETGLNTSLTQAIALLHDIGHTPFGHLGERCISALSAKTFKHEIMSVNIAKADVNAAYETLVGIMLHSRGMGKMVTNGDVVLEYDAVMFADKLSYVFKDTEDALSIGYLQPQNLPAEYFYLDLSTCISELVKESKQEGRISFSQCEAARQFADLRSWLYINFYTQLDLGPERERDYKDMCAVEKLLREHRDYLQFDPLTALVIMDNNEIRSLAKLALEPREKELTAVLQQPWVQLYKQLEGVDLFECDLRPELFS